MRRLEGISVDVPYTVIEGGKPVTKVTHVIRVGRFMPELPSEGDIVKARENRDGAAGVMSSVAKIEE